MDNAELKSLIWQVIEDPSISGEANEQTDKLLSEIIRIEKKHLYGINQTSSNRRQEEIQKVIDKHLSSSGAEHEDNNGA